MIKNMIKNSLYEFNWKYLDKWIYKRIVFLPFKKKNISFALLIEVNIRVIYLYVCAINIYNC